MKKMSVALAVLAWFVFASGSSLYSAQFDPLFRVTKINGECSVQTPESKEFVAAEEGKAYEYGSKVKTGRKSSAVVLLSDNNECRLMANTLVTVTKDMKEAKLKVIKLDTGKVEVELEQEFGKVDALNIETPTAICAAIGCKYTVEVDPLVDPDLITSTFVCISGKIRVFGPHFDIAILDEDDCVTVAGNKERNFFRVRNSKGLFEVKLRDAEGTEKPFELKPGATVKVFRSKSAKPGFVNVALLVTGPDGKTVQESINYAEAMAEGEQIGESTGAPGEGVGKPGEQPGEKPKEEAAKRPSGKPKEKPKAKREEAAGAGGGGVDDAKGWPVMSTTTTTTSTTTTTTIPSLTPVGRR